MHLKIVERDGSPLCNANVKASGSVKDLCEVIHKSKPQYHWTQMRLSLAGSEGQKPTVLNAQKKLSDYGLAEGDTISFKNLGPQLWFRTVFFWEYLGPILIYPLFAFRIIPVYGVNAAPLTATQQVALLMWTIHYVKRELETFFVHEFGDLTMPRRNIIKNSVYYWGFAAFVGWMVNRPGCCKGELGLNFKIGLPMMIFFMLLNFGVHLKLRSMRPKNSSVFVMPTGIWFSLVTAPNYFAEIMTWFSFNIMTKFTIAGILFNLAGFYQMREWAAQKHRGYKRDFKNYPKSRKIMIPFIY